MHEKLSRKVHPSCLMYVQPSQRQSVLAFTIHQLTVGSGLPGCGCIEMSLFVGYNLGVVYALACKMDCDMYVSD